MGENVTPNKTTTTVVVNKQAKKIQLLFAVVYGAAVNRMQVFTIPSQCLREAHKLPAQSRHQPVTILVQQQQAVILINNNTYVITRTNSQ